MKKSKNKINSFSTFNIFKKILILSVLVYLIIDGGINIYYNSIYTPYVLKRNPVCTNALVVKDYIASRHLGRWIDYRFVYNKKNYEGSYSKGDLKIGDSVRVVFLKSNPAINKPLSYFKDGEINCK